MSTQGMMMVLASSGRRTLKTYNFPAGTSSWVCPATTYQVETVYGKGSNGTPAIPPAPVNASTKVAEVAFLGSSGTGNTGGAYTWSALDGGVSSAQSAFNSGNSSASYTDQFVIQYISTYTYTGTGRTVGTAVIAGSATISYSGGWVPGGGVCNSDGAAYINWQYYDSGTPGTVGNATSGFGFSFSGGAYGPATPSTQGPTNVTPGTTYTATVATGGFLTITYYE